MEQALEAADMTMVSAYHSWRGWGCDDASVVFLQDEIDSVILVGGGTRVPRVQELLLKTVDK